MVMVVLLSATVTSCDPDDDIAYTLEGTWKGYMGVYRDYDNRDYGSTYTELYFERDPYRYSSGRGYWVDYYKEHPWSSRNYVASRISWPSQGHSTIMPGMERMRAKSSMHWWVAPSSPTLRPPWEPTTFTFRRG